MAAGLALTAVDEDDGSDGPTIEATCGALDGPGIKGSLPLGFAFGGTGVF